jgi:hypothetical protein
MESQKTLLFFEKYEKYLAHFMGSINGFARDSSLRSSSVKFNLFFVYSLLQGNLCLRMRSLTEIKNQQYDQGRFRKKRMHVLRRVLIVSPHSHQSHQILFHPSFSEWFLDVKYCTQTYLCQAAYRLLNSSKFFSDPQLIPIFLLSVGVKVPETSEFELQA